VAAKIIFTNVAAKEEHIARACIVDLFLDTPECNAHTTATDVLWSGTPLLTLPRYEYKMCSRMAASILRAALPVTDEGNKTAGELIAAGEEEYEQSAVKLARGLVYVGEGEASGRLFEIRQLLYEERWRSALFDTKQWVRGLEDAYEMAWRRWVDGAEGDIHL
jgi:predicted O-linked N-acetylglucosamine transferase (SPINDLY family)